jgi:hypothetical protein
MIHITERSLLISVIFELATKTSRFARYLAVGDPFGQIEVGLIHLWRRMNSSGDHHERND